MLSSFRVRLISDKRLFILEDELDVSAYIRA